MMALAPSRSSGVSLAQILGLTGPPAERAWGPGESISVCPALQGEVTIHYNKLQADPKQGMSLDIGKLGRNGGVQLPHKPQLLVCLQHVSNYVAGFSGFSDQVCPQASAGVGGG